MQHSQIERQYIKTDDFEDLSKSILSTQVFDYIKSGANEEVVVRRNKEIFNEVFVNPSVCIDVGVIDASTTVLGNKISIPVGFAPMGFQKLVHPEGEKNVALASISKNVIYTQSVWSSIKMQDIPKGLNWFQIFIFKNKNMTQQLIKKAEQNNFKALVITVSSPILGKNIDIEKSRFVIPNTLNIESLEYLDQNQKKGGPTMKFFQDLIDPAATWEDVKWVQSLTQLPIVLKGVQCYEDAKIAASMGLHIWVSNHGGRISDSIRTSLEMLPECAQAVKESGNSKLEVYVDGGIRKGSDILKCLALGARCVFIGRSQMYSNACEGQRGVEKLLQLYKDELELTMRLMGVTHVSQLNNSHIVKSTIPKPNL